MDTIDNNMDTVDNNMVTIDNDMDTIDNDNFFFKKKGYIQVIGDTARISGTGQITAIVSDYSCPSISAGG